MELSTVIGLAAAILLIVVAIAIGGSPLAFINIPSLLITVGGGLAASLTSFPMKDFFSGLKAIGKAFNPGLPDPVELVDYLVNVANKARRDGILALESDIDEYYSRDPFFGSLMRMLIDGQDIEEIKSNADTALMKIEQDLSTEVSVWEALGELFPAFGMIGTLIGLIQMLQNLNDPSALGPGMAVAMITTLYGAILANVLCVPISKKLKLFKDLNLLFKEAYVITVEAINNGTNPNVLRSKLLSLFGIEGGEE
jgi:chemotaxis protein MotA